MAGQKPNFADLAFGEPSKAVYVIEAFPSLKIGISRDPAKRARQLQVGQDREVCVFWAIRLAASDAQKVETEVHRRLGSRNIHMRGEWYAFSPMEARAEIERVIGDLGFRSQLDLEFGIR